MTSVSDDELSDLPAVRHQQPLVQSRNNLNISSGINDTAVLRSRQLEFCPVVQRSNYIAATRRQSCNLSNHLYPNRSFRDSIIAIGTHKLPSENYWSLNYAWKKARLESARISCDDGHADGGRVDWNRKGGRRRFIPNAVKAFR